MFPLIHVWMAAREQAAEREKQLRREEEEVMGGYTPQDLSQHWQFKIVRGTFKTAAQVERVVEEQAEHGWILVEIFDHARIRFKRPASETTRDSHREGNPYATVSKASAPGCAAAAVLLAALGAGVFFWLA
jgi:hypothetical protein